MQTPTKSKLPQKQLLKIPLFRSVRQINGQRIFKHLHETCYSLSYETRCSDKELSLKQNFIYVKEGEVLVYKVAAGGTGGGTGGGNGMGNGGKSLMKSYRMEEYCGFQDYPLFWGEDILVEVNSKSTLIIVPLVQFYRFFRRVIPMTYLHSKSQFLKHLPLFRGIQLQKIFKLACLSQKYRITKQQQVMKQGDPIDNIIIIYSGKLELRSTMLGGDRGERDRGEVVLVGQNQEVFVKEVRENVEVCFWGVRCVQEADVLVIPKAEFRKIMDIRYNIIQASIKDNDPNNRQQTIYQDNKSQQSLSSYFQPKSRNMPNFSKSLLRKTTTEPNQKPQPHTRNLKSANQRTQIICNRDRERDRERERTLEGEDSQGYGYRKMMTQTNYSLGEIQLLKFIRRKEKIQNRNFFKYIESRAPEIVLNPSKQFALLKPFYKSTSQYVRNMKRRLKQSMSINQSVNLTTHFNDFTI